MRCCLQLTNSHIRFNHIGNLEVDGMQLSEEQEMKESVVLSVNLYFFF
jgi:hypothetical protein